MAHQSTVDREIVLYYNTMYNWSSFQIEWAPVLPHQDLVYALANGSLLFYPFSAEKYRHEIHATVYR